MPERETKAEKAQRLINERRVARLAEGIYGIRGDSGTYLTTVVPDQALAQRSGVPVGSCTCEGGRSNLRTVCSHVMSAHSVEKHVQGGGAYDVTELARDGT